MKREKSCGAVVFKGNQVLLIEHVLGHIDFPKGHMELGETEEETAIREVREETNIEISLDSKYRYTISYSPSDGVVKDVVFFLGYYKEGQLKAQPLEVLHAFWVPEDQVLDLLSWENTKEAFKALRKFKKQEE